MLCCTFRDSGSPLVTAVRDKRDGARDTSAVGHTATLLGVGQELKKAGTWLNALLTRF